MFWKRRAAGGEDADDGDAEHEATFWDGDAAAAAAPEPLLAPVDGDGDDGDGERARGGAGRPRRREATFAESFHTARRFAPDGSFEALDRARDEAEGRALPFDTAWAFARSQRDPRAGGGARTVVVEPLPMLHASRTPRGGWRLDNEYVVFLSGVTDACGADAHYGLGAAHAMRPDQLAWAGAGDGDAGR